LRILADGHVSKTRAQPGHLDDAQGLVAHVTERLQGMPQATPIISGGMNALRLPANGGIVVGTSSRSLVCD
jgi:hypothetical protein